MRKTNARFDRGSRRQFILVALLAAFAARAEAQTNRFLYDNLGRVAVVLGTNGADAAFYDYDAVGNITAIRRQTLGPVNLLIYSPESAGGNETLTLQGTGFSTNLANNTVLFGSLTAQVVSATANQLKVLVPTNVVTGLICVFAPTGVSTNSKTFNAGLRVQVSPAVTNLAGATSLQFNAAVYGSTNQNVIWSLNGWIPAGSNTAWGTVSETGYYTAPVSPPPGAVVTVQARSVADSNPLNDGKARVTITPLVLTTIGPIYSPTISAQPGVPTVLGPIYSPTVSVGPQQ